MARTLDLKRLLRAATRARELAYAPYSQFPVGAAVLASGRIYAACNVENGSFPLSVCAERNDRLARPDRPPLAPVRARLAE